MCCWIDGVERCGGLGVSAIEPAFAGHESSRVRSVPGNSSKGSVAPGLRGGAICEEINNRILYYFAVASSWRTPTSQS